MTVGSQDAVVTTVRGPIAASSLGATDAHEHLFLRSVHLPGEEFTELEPTVAEVEMLRASGIDAVVDLTPVGLGRDPDQLREVSRRTRVHVVAATGFHRDAHYPPGHWVFHEPAEVLVDVMVTDLNEGMDARDWQGPIPKPTHVRAGIIKLGASYQRITSAERKRMRAGAEAARRTNRPIAVHCEIGTMGHEVLDLLLDNGVTPDRVALAHLDRNLDADLHAELAERGAYLIYDTVGRVKYRPESTVIDLVVEMADRGHAERLLLGTDVGRASMLRSRGGGPGMDVLGRTFLPRLTTKAGPAVVDPIIRSNPARLLGC